MRALPEPDPAKAGGLFLMHPVTVFDNIRIEAPRERIYRRLGYRRGITRMSALQDAEVDTSIVQALALIRLQGAARRLPIRKRDEAQVILAADGGETALVSRTLAGFLGGGNEVLLMGATAGSAIVDAIREDVGGSHVTRGVIFDAVASETVDASLDWIMAYFRQELRRENKFLTDKRYSAGYGDFLLENQRSFVRFLDLQRIGVELTASCVLVPEKSVTAVAGIGGR